MQKDLGDRVIKKKVERSQNVSTRIKDIRDYYVNSQRFTSQNPHTSPKTQKQEGISYESRSDDKTAKPSKEQVPLCPELNLTRLGFTLDNHVESSTNLKSKIKPFESMVERIKRREKPDCVVLFADRKFTCHLIILQSFSKLVDDMNSFKKFNLNPERCSIETFEWIYNWMISSEDTPPDLTRKNLLTIYIASQYLIIKDLLALCNTLLNDWNVFNEETAFIMYLEAKEKGVDEIREMMFPRIQRFFFVLVSSEEWVTMELEDVKTFLKSNYILINSEIEIFGSALRWLKHDWDNRRPKAVELLQCVRWGNLKSWQLVNLQRNKDAVEYRELTNDPEIAEMIEEGLSYTTFRDISQFRENLDPVTETLSLREPNSRNWSGLGCTHYTYPEFLKFLYTYRKQEFLAKVARPNTNEYGSGDNPLNVEDTDEDNVENEEE